MAVYREHMKKPLLSGGVFVLTESVSIAGFALARKTFLKPLCLRSDLGERVCRHNGACALAAMLRRRTPGLEDVTRREGKDLTP